MSVNMPLLTYRKSLDEICRVPDKIISVYSLEKHVWNNGNAPEARSDRQPELQTIEEFQIDPVRSFLNDILRGMAAPYRPERRDAPIGQGYWIQAEFGSGKSHLLCFLSALALGDPNVWALVQEKEKQAKRGRRESLYRFWEEGLEAKSTGKNKGVFTIVKTLVGTGGGTVGVNTRGRPLVDYIMEAASEQIQLELGRNLSIYPSELLADKFLSELELYKSAFQKFLKDPQFFTDIEIERNDFNEFVRQIQDNRSPEYKRSVGNKLWDFYTKYLKVTPQVAAEAEEVLKHLVETLLAEGYSGVLLVLDEVSLFMKNRDDDQRVEDEKTLVVLSNRLAKVHNLPIWTVCAAQQAIESKMGVKNIIAEDRLKLVELLREDNDYYNIVLARVREIVKPDAIGAYYLYYKRGFTWTNAIGEAEFAHFFPFHKPALEVLRSITYELTTTRSAIHFMHQTLKQQIKQHGTELIRLWELFDEAVRYEEDPSGVHASITAIKTKRETDYRAYEVAKRQIEDTPKGTLKVYRDKAVKTLQTLFLYHIARTRQQGLNPEEIANSVLIERAPDSNPDENIQHYEQISEKLKVDLRQIVQTFDEDRRPRYRFDPIFTGVDPRAEFRKVRDDAETDEQARLEAFNFLLALDEWPVKTRQMTIDLAGGTKSIFRPIAKRADQSMDIIWRGRQIIGTIGMRDPRSLVSTNTSLPAIDSDADQDFAVYIASRPVSQEVVQRVLPRKDPRVLLWIPDDLNSEEANRLLDFTAYRKLVATWEGKDTEDAVAVINWVANALQTEIGKIIKIVDNSYGRGRISALNNMHLSFHVAGELPAILSPLIDKVLSSVYESREIEFDPRFMFRNEEAVKVINGIVKMGEIPKGTKPNQNISAAQNFGFGLKIIKRGADRELDVSDNPFVQDLWAFIDQKLPDDRQSMPIQTLYKNFMGIGIAKSYGLSRRLIQLYVLCLVRQGKIRIALSPRSGLPAPLIDYANIAEIDFAAKILDAFTEVQKVAQPENWDVLRPYAAKLLEQDLSATQDEADIAAFRKQLRDLFDGERDESQRVVTTAQRLFESLGTAPVYLTESQRIANLFATDLSTGDDIDRMLLALKVTFGYEAYEQGVAKPSELDDLANHFQRYRKLQKFLVYETDLRTADAYCKHPLPERAELRQARQYQRAVATKLNRLDPFVDEDVRLKTELVGSTPPQQGDGGTIKALVHEYTNVYVAFHDIVLERIEEERRAIRELIDGEELQAFRRLEQVTALQPAMADQLVREIEDIGRSMFTCLDPSKTSIIRSLATMPIHSCGLTFENGSEHLDVAQRASAEARQRFAAVLNSKFEVFTNPAVRERLEQGRNEPVVASILRCSTVAEVRAELVRLVATQPDIVETVNRYLKRIVVKRVRMSDFKPSLGTIQRNQIDEVAREFQRYLEDQLRTIEDNDGTLPVLQVE